MDEIVIRIFRSGGPPNESMSMSLRKPSSLNDVAQPFLCKADEEVFTALTSAQLKANSVKEAGERLFNELIGNPHIEPHLKAAVQAAAGSRLPISVEIATAMGAEALPWEAICSPNGEFLGLDERWSLARMVDPQRESAAFQTLTPPIRIAAVLSCLGISAQGELDALRSAIEQAGRDNVELLVLSGEDQLILDLRAEVAAGTAPEVVGVEIMPADLAGLTKRIADFGPHLLHFFCHGSLDGSPHVAIGNKDDWATQSGVSSITAEAGEFKDFIRATEGLPWLVVLNCCEGAGAQTATESQSLALALVWNGIAPAVVGLREPVVDTTANQVTEGLYNKLLTDLVGRIESAAVSPQPSPQPVDWPRLVVAARDKLAHSPGKPRSQAAASSKLWTLPVIYVRPDQFKLQVSAAPPASRGGVGEMKIPPVRDPEADRAALLEIQLLQALLTDLPPTQADHLKADAEARIAELAQQLGITAPLTGGP